MRFTVNGSVWRLQFARTGDRRLRRSDGSYTIGMSDNNVKTVFIADSLSEYMTGRVIRHELVHCICFEYNLTMPIEVEERIADFMAGYGQEVIYLADRIMDDLYNLSVKFA